MATTAAVTSTGEAAAAVQAAAGISLFLSLCI
jgi:hypothetical protein